jgi:hypothetical protein
VWIAAWPQSDCRLSMVLRRLTHTWRGYRIARCFMDGLLQTGCAISRQAWTGMHAAFIMWELSPTCSEEDLLTILRTRYGDAAQREIPLSLEEPPSEARRIVAGLIPGHFSTVGSQLSWRNCMDRLFVSWLETLSMMVSPTRKCG